MTSIKEVSGSRTDLGQKLNSSQTRHNSGLQVPKFNSVHGHFSGSFSVMVIKWPTWHDLRSDFGNNRVISSKIIIFSQACKSTDIQYVNFPL
jgi:hypothetical protein